MRYKQTNERRAVILMVVLALLTLFAIVGITFVLYADAEAASARVARQAETQQRADVDPQQALSFFLGQLIYDVLDSPTTAGSALRGHSLARTMFGGNNVTGNNNTPYNGLGRLHTDGANWSHMNPYGMDDFLLINYTYFPADGFARDPEWYGNAQTVPGAGKNSNMNGTYYVGCNAPYTYPDFNNLFLAAIRSDGMVLAPSFHRAYQGAAGSYFGTLDPSNPNWYGGSHSLRYMVMRPRPADHPNFPAPEDAGGDVRNVPWSQGGKDPITGKLFQNDSFWMDLGAPVMTAPDGTKYKMLFAPCIMDLDNRLHVGAAGNLKGNNTASRSNQGWFPSEVNLSTLWSTSATNTADWLNIFMGYPPVSPPTGYYGKYGQNQIPSGALFPTGSPAHWYAQADLDGSNEMASGAPTGAFQLPGTAASAPATIPFPYFPPGFGSGSTGERTNHPAGYPALAPSGGDLVFSAADMEQLLRPNSIKGANVDSGSSALISYLTRLCPNSLGAGATITQRRNWITTLSADLTKSGVSPWIYDPVNVVSYPTPPSAPFPFGINAVTPWLAPVGGTLAFPAYTQIQAQASKMPPPSPPLGSDFINNPSGVDWRSAIARLGRIDLNQQLPPFPHMSSGGTLMMTNTPNDRFDAASTKYTQAQILNQFQSAMQARQSVALGLYNALMAVTGVPPLSNVVTPTAADLAPRRWLAQLAANIVDYIDDDDISTPFNFFDPNNSGNPAPPSGANSAGNNKTIVYQVDDPAGAAPNTAVTPTVTTIPAFAGPAPGGNPDVPAYWVFGTELPRIVINEVLGEYTLPTNKASPPVAAAGTFNVNLWVELFNPLPPAATVTTAATTNGSILQPLDAMSVPLYMPANGALPAYNQYQLVLSNNGEIPLPPPAPNPPVTVPIPNSQGLWYNALGLNNNVLGTPQQLRYSNPAAPAGVGTPAICNFQLGAGSIGTVAAPATTTFSISAAGGGLPGQAYMLVGPSTTNVNNDLTVAAGVPATTPIYASPAEMSYQVSFNPTPAAGQSQWQITVPGVAAPVSIYDNTNGVSVLLRRLANPHLPPNPFLATGLLTNPLLPPNPYITVDYVSGALLNGYGLNATPAPVPISTFAAPIPIYTPVPSGPASIGKLEPYAANLAQFSAQSTARTGTVGLNDHHTMGLPNQPLANPFTWLVHLDRLLISPMELLHVSGFAPHQLTQRFIYPTTVPNPAGGAPIPNPQLVLQPYSYTAPAAANANGTVPAGYNPANYVCFQHYAPWFNQANRLYRLFELLQTHNGASGLSGSNRVPGNININTLWDPPTTYPLIYQAITDPSVTPNNPNFTTANVQAMFQKLLTLRTPNLGTPALSPADRPFLGMGAGVTPPGVDTQFQAAYGFPNGNGINHTLLTSGVAGVQPIIAGTGAALQLPITAPVINPTQPPQQYTHPYMQNELLTKIYNRLTTRSHVFAVFLTVGFFEVTTANGAVVTVDGMPNSPPQLGAEIGRSEGREIRHRMFAIVDRSHLPQFVTPSPWWTTPYDPRSDTAVVPYFSIID